MASQTFVEYDMRDMTEAWSTEGPPKNTESLAFCEKRYSGKYPRLSRGRPGFNSPTGRENEGIFYFLASIPACHAGDRGSIPRQREKIEEFLFSVNKIIVASIPACHAGDRGSIPRQGEKIEEFFFSVTSPERDPEIYPDSY
ncbi:hypothetical protein GQR58_014723 [Nymphon striatum]|nr:hypothetical protein GQR58_014723 [Nymphon striatum]